MRIDPVFCEKILIAIESDPRAGSGGFVEISIEGHDEKETAYHVKHLWEANMVDGLDVTSNSSPYPTIMVRDITHAGRKFLDDREPSPQQPGRKIGFV